MFVSVLFAKRIAFCLCIPLLKCQSLSSGEFGEDGAVVHCLTGGNTDVCTMLVTRGDSDGVSIKCFSS